MSSHLDRDKPMSGNVGPASGATPHSDSELLALRKLGAYGAENAFASRLGKQAGAAYLRSSRRESPSIMIRALTSRFAVMLPLACVVGLYMRWALTAAASLVQP